MAHWLPRVEASVSGAIVFISHFRIKEGMADGLMELQRRVAKSLEAEKPRTLAFLQFLARDGETLSIVHVFADAASMDVHVEGAEARSSAAYEYVVPEGWEIYGTPSEHVTEGIRRRAASSGVPLTMHPELVGGFLRLAAAPDS
jgi:hypothetical protein